MPPKKSTSKASTAGDKRKREEPEKKPDAAKDEKEDEAAKDEGSDLKEEAEDPEPKTKSAKTTSPLDWLLSDEAFEMANPEIPKGHGEVDWTDGNQKTPPPESAGKHDSKDETILRYPHSHLTPFQNLVAACLLSKPISHKLGLRTIQTLLNPPFGLRTLADLDEAGYEGRRKVMWEARTQHKEKTANQLGDVVEGVKELCVPDGGDEDDQSEMTGLREQLEGMKAEEAQEKVKAVLTKIKGIGPGVVGIFLRRVQADWEEVYPYADEKSLTAAKKFGILEDGQGAEVLAEKVKDRKEYVKLLDTLIGLELEKVIDKAVDLAKA